MRTGGDFSQGIDQWRTVVNTSVNFGFKKMWVRS